MPNREKFTSFTVSLAGVETAVCNAISQTAAQLAILGLSEDEMITIQLVLAEALNNIIEHALPYVGKPTGIRIKADYNACGLDLVITDEGAPMRNHALPNPPAPDINVDIAMMPEGGFGWFMIRSLVQDVSYRRKDGLNHLTLRLAVGG
ncbi:serine/threonine-protein kinase RsbW [Sulfitobacter undariae]|uniref:Serine/threonine-protein kinase RsbW n=1 Tax=Sulfitobacter undariae TaxID=1563671 RepID=A0A7W6H0R3_9RHOB|nr:ATP-binding protein [Sulfitobacter undariae]MBB3994352.1 serine/threonine-protein kinase RsbW [Sulfitobacter undariae]